MQIALHKTRDFGRKLNATIEFIKENFKPLFKSLLYIAGPFVIIGSILFTHVYSNLIMTSMSQINGTIPQFDDYISMAIFGVSGAIFLMLGGTAIITTVYEYVKLYEKTKGENIVVKDVWEKVKKSYFSVLGTMLLYMVLLVVAYVIVIIPTAMLSAAAPGLMVILMIVVLCGFIYAGISFSLIFIVRSYENVSFGAAISRCFYLIKGKWWSTFGLLFVVGMIQGLISSIFMVPWYIMLVTETMHNLESQTFQDPSILYQIINNVTLLLYFICSYMLYALPLIAIAFQYFNLVEMKEARGLMSKIESFGIEKDQNDDEEHY